MKLRAEFREQVTLIGTDPSGEAVESIFHTGDEFPVAKLNDDFVEIAPDGYRFKVPRQAVFLIGLGIRGVVPAGSTNPDTQEE